MSIQTKEEFEQEVIDLFLNTKMSLRAIAKRYDRKSYDFIYGILNKYNINPKRRHIANKIKIEDLTSALLLLFLLIFPSLPVTILLYITNCNLCIFFII